MIRKIETAIIWVLLAFLPFLVRLKIMPTPTGSQIYLTHPMGENIGDFFHYTKSRVLIILGVAILLTLIFKSRIKKTYYYIGMGLYAVGVILSSFLSPFREIVLNGGGNRYEGALVLCSYALVTFFVVNYVEDKKDVKVVISAAVMGIILVSLAGITEFFGMSIYKLPFLQKLALPDARILEMVKYPTGYISMAQVIKYSHKFHNVQGTLGNSNYTGSYAAMSLFILMPFILKAKKTWVRYLFVALYSLNLSLLVASRSRAGMYAAAASFVVFLILSRNEIRKRIMFIPELVLSTLAVFFFLNFLSGGEIKNHVAELENEGRAITQVSLREVESRGDTLKITSFDKSLILKANPEGVIFFEGDGTPLQPDFDGTRITFLQEGYGKYIFEVREPGLMAFLYDDIRYPIVVEGNGFKTLGWSRRSEKIIMPERVKAMDRYILKGSSRGYIWSRSIPILKKTGLLGFGPDTYPIIFPQNDYFGKSVAYGTPYMFVSKPHNLYLQIAINTGILSLVGFLILVVAYILDSLRIYFKTSYDNYFEVVGLGCCTAVLGYLIAGMFNDSAVSVAPTFWAILGLGISINLKLRNGEKEVL